MTPKIQKELYKVSGFELSNKYITKNMNNKLSMIMHKHGKVLSPLTKSETRQISAATKGFGCYSLKLNSISISYLD
jgi:hypothetical protein